MNDEFADLDRQANRRFTLYQADMSRCHADLPAFSRAILGALLALRALSSPGMRSFQSCSFASARGLDLLTPRCLVSSDRALDLLPFRLRCDLDEHGHDRAGPERPTEGVEQVGQKSKQPARRRGQENVSSHVSGQADHEADHKALVQKALP